MKHSNAIALCIPLSPQPQKAQEFMASAGTPRRFTELHKGEVTIADLRGQRWKMRNNAKRIYYKMKTNEMIGLLLYENESFL